MSLSATSTSNVQSLADQLAAHESLVLDVKDEVRGEHVRGWWV